MIVRAALTVLITGLLAFHAVRTAAVRDDPAGFARQLWPGHPDVELWQLMTEVGTRARAGQGLTPAMLGRADDIAREAPLAAEPLLIKGALAQLNGQDERAEPLFVEAARRDPRSHAARYFLADRYLRTGRVPQALEEMAALARLVPGASAHFAPSLAQFATQPGSLPAIRAFLRASPEFENPVLLELARSERNAGLVLALWSGAKPTEGIDWRERLLAALVAKGQFANAHSVWRRVSGAGGATAALFNPQFRKIEAPPPFNWRFAAAGGVAEPTGDGRLEVVYYGREDAVLAEQLLLLPPGPYRIAMEVSGPATDGTPLRWRVLCLPGGRPIAEVPLQPAQPPARVGAAFAVPPGCQAQQLRLVGEPPEFPRSIEITIRNLVLAKAGGR